MSKVNKIHTRFILEVVHEGVEYHVTISDDLKTILDIDVLPTFDTKPGTKPLQETALRELIREAFMKNELDLD